MWGLQRGGRASYGTSFEVHNARNSLTELRPVAKTKRLGGDDAVARDQPEEVSFLRRLAGSSLSRVRPSSDASSAPHEQLKYLPYLPRYCVMIRSTYSSIVLPFSLTFGCKWRRLPHHAATANEQRLPFHQHLSHASCHESWRPTATQPTECE